MSTIRSHPGVCTCRRSLPFLLIISICYHFPPEGAMCLVRTMSPRPLQGMLLSGWLCGQDDSRKNNSSCSTCAM